MKDECRINLLMYVRPVWTENNIYYLSISCLYFPLSHHGCNPITWQKTVPSAVLFHLFGDSLYVQTLFVFYHWIMNDSRGTWEKTLKDW